MERKFKSELGGKHAGEWEFAFATEAASLEAWMLGNDVTIAELSRMAKVAKETMVKFLSTGARNKAWRSLKDRHLL